MRLPRFLKLAGWAGALAVSAASGYAVAPSPQAQPALFESRVATLERQVAAVGDIVTAHTAAIRALQAAVKPQPPAPKPPPGPTPTPVPAPAPVAKGDDDPVATAALTRFFDQTVVAFGVLRDKARANPADLDSAEFQAHGIILVERQRLEAALRATNRKTTDPDFGPQLDRLVNSARKARGKPLP